jgi:hypothetical protein
MTITLGDILRRPSSTRTAPLILDHASFGSHRLLRDRPVPWTDPVSCQSYFGQAQSLFRPDATLVDVGAAYAQQLALRPELAEAMAARTRTGFALKTLLAYSGVSTEVAQLVRVLSQTSREPLVLQIPSPVRWLALAQLAAGASDLSGLQPDHAEGASMYVADWLRGFEDLPVAVLLLDARRDDVPGLAGLPADELTAYTPLTNLTGHYRWGLAMRTDDTLDIHGAPDGGVLLAESFWDDGAVPAASLMLGEVPTNLEPEQVLARLELLA